MPDEVDSVLVVFTGASAVFVEVIVAEDAAFGVEVGTPSFTF